MIRGHIPADYYWKPDVLKREIKAVFEKTWLCVAFIDDLVNHQDFVTAQIGPHNVVVQNFKGALRAFRNVCSHRFARIQTERCGNRRLQCPYHGWLYDQEGKPTGIPDNANSFGFNEAERAALSLTSYRLEVCGRFVFISMAKEGISLREFLGRIYDDLEHFTQVCPRRIRTLSTEIEVNWKIGFENAAEGYHVQRLHKDSLGPTLGKDLSIDFVEDHSIYIRALSESTRTWWDRVANIVHLKSGNRFPESTNYIIFPHTVALATRDSSFVLQTYTPIDSTRFRCDTTYWIAEAREGPALEALADNLLQLNDRIMAEDADICLAVQAGVRDVPDRQTSLLGSSENRIAHFQRAYSARMGL